MAKRAKIEEIQYLRGFAFLAVVLQHAIGHYAYLPEAGLQDGVLLGILLIASKFAVPLFIFITGLVLFYNYRDPVSYGSFLRKRCKDIVLPYAVWTVVYGLLFGGDHGTAWAWIKQFVLDLFTGKASYHLWYVVMVIQLYIVFPWLQPLLLRIHKSLKSWQLTAWFIVLAAFYVWLTGQVSVIGSAAEKLQLPVLTPFFTEYADRNALYFYLYFLMGAAAGLNLESWKTKIMSWKACWLGLFTIVSGILLYQMAASFRTDAGIVIQFNNTLLVQPFMALFLSLSVVAMCIVSVVFERSAGPRMKRMLTVLGHYSYSAYLAHALLLNPATLAADWALPGWNATLKTLAAFAVCTLLSVGLAVLLGKFSLGRLLSGIPAPRKSAA
ncbi:acyltransferase [Paenibacillus piri]|uniref:Acyltransferase n=1 Tax=Paenibacillus piri TaxID=2547395 RepID=A0A4R5KLZ9_9BACL|nr:acyltransferase [Paenibacillus piri]TDF96611.1 acyltransferase [Paenibacillus piri]